MWRGGQAGLRRLRPGSGAGGHGADRANLLRMWLVCSQRCGGSLFRALFTEVDVDAGGDYQGHRVVQPGYLCLNCGAPAVDLGQVPEAMDEEEEEESVAVSLDVLCPICETLVSVVPGEECPNCGAALEVV